MAITAGTNHAGHRVGEPLNRRARALCFADHPHDLREQTCRRRRARRASRASRCRSWCRRSPRSRRLLDRNRLTGHHRLVDALVAPSSTTPSTGTRSPGRTRSRSPTATCSSGTSCSRPSASMRRAVGGASAEQVADRGAGASPAREVRAPGRAGRGPRSPPPARSRPPRRRSSGTSAGRGPARRGHHAVPEGRTDAERDQREHVEVTVRRSTPSPVRRTASPPTDTTGVAKRQLHPDAPRCRQQVLQRLGSGSRLDGHEREDRAVSSRHDTHNRRVMSSSSGFAPRPSRRAARAPSRTSGTPPARRARPPGASDRSTRSWSAGAASPARAPCRTSDRPRPVLPDLRIHGAGVVSLDRGACGRARSRRRADPGMTSGSARIVRDSSRCRSSRSCPCRSE